MVHADAEGRLVSFEFLANSIDAFRDRRLDISFAQVLIRQRHAHGVRLRDHAVGKRLEQDTRALLRCWLIEWRVPGMAQLPSGGHQEQFGALWQLALERGGNLVEREVGRNEAEHERRTARNVQQRREVRGIEFAALQVSGSDIALF